jgi:hypothetical protein
MKMMEKDGQVNFNDHFSFASLMASSPGWKNFVDDGPEQAAQIPLTLSIKEFDPTLTSAINFSDPEAFKALVCPLGLEELRATVRYEMVNLNLLIVATRTNQALLDNAQRKLTEITLFEQGYAVANPAWNLVELLNDRKYTVESNIHRLGKEERNKLTAMIGSKIGPHYYNILPKKKVHREVVEKAYATMKRAVREQGKDEARPEVLLRQLRTMRVALCHDFCQEVNATVCLDSMRMQLLHETAAMRKRAYLLPKEHMVHKLWPSVKGEHEFFHYNAQPEAGSEEAKKAAKLLPSDKVFYSLQNR